MSWKVIMTLSFLFLGSASQSAQRTSGTYETLISGRPIATEKYTLATLADGSIKAEGEITIGGGVQKVVTVVQRQLPVSFSVEAAGRKVVAAEFRKGSVTLKVATQPDREIKTDATVILENLVWHQYLFLFDQYDTSKGGNQSFRVFVPSVGQTVSLTFVPVGSPIYHVAGKQVNARQFRLEAESGLTIDLWTDEMYLPLVFSIPSQGAKAIRTGWESLAEAILQPSTNPSPDALFKNEDVAFQNGEMILSATLSLPKNVSARVPGAVLISGSGPQDRDGNPAGNNIYRLIGDQLANHGVAVLRHDDRGVGRSSTPTKPTTYRDLIDDTKSAIAYLRSRQEVDPGKIVLIGHSEGGETAAVIATEDPRVAGVVFVAGAYLENIERLLLEQTIYQGGITDSVDPADRRKLPKLVQQILGIIEEAKAGKSDEKPSDLHEYFRQHLAIDLPALYRRIKCPVLLLQGERDALVLAYHAVEVAMLLAESENNDVTLRIFPGLSHGFSPSPLDHSLSGPQKLEVSKEFILTLQTWVTEKFGIKNSRGQ